MVKGKQLKGILPKTYTSFRNDLLKELLRIFNYSALNKINDELLDTIEQAAVDVIIRDTLWSELPESYDDSQLHEYRRKIYEFVYSAYPAV